MDQVKVGRRRVVDQWESVHDGLSWERRRDGDGEVEELAGWVDPRTQRPSGKAEVSGEAGVLEPDRSLPVRSNPPKPGLVVGHEQIAGAIKNEVVPHRYHP